MTRSKYRVYPSRYSWRISCRLLARRRIFDARFTSNELTGGSSRFQEGEFKTVLTYLSGAVAHFWHATRSHLPAFALSRGKSNISFCADVFSPRASVAFSITAPLFARRLSSNAPVLAASHSKSVPWSSKLDINRFLQEKKISHNVLYFSFCFFFDIYKDNYNKRIKEEIKLQPAFRNTAVRFNARITCNFSVISNYYIEIKPAVLNNNLYSVWVLLILIFYQILLFYYARW